jgi:hypothetical protein
LINISLFNPELLFDHGDHPLSVDSGRLSILLALAPNLVGRVGLRLFVKLVPAAGGKLPGDVQCPHRNDRESLVGGCVVSRHHWGLR